MKFVKFGYGRGSDHASKDKRTGYMTRNEGIELVKKYDSVISSDLVIGFITWICRWMNFGRLLIRLGTLEFGG